MTRSTSSPPRWSGQAGQADIARLRHFQKVFKGPNMAKAYHDMGDEIGAAADEIEKLRVQVVSLQSSLNVGPPRLGKKTPQG